MSSEGEFKKRILYGHRTFMDLYYDREARFSELQKNIEVHPDPLLDGFVPHNELQKWLEEAKKEIFGMIKQRAEQYPDALWWCDFELFLDVVQCLEKWFGAPEQ